MKTFAITYHLETKKKTIHTSIAAETKEQAIEIFAGFVLKIDGEYINRRRLTCIDFEDVMCDRGDV